MKPIATFIIALLSFYTLPSIAQTNVLLQFAERVGKATICDLKNVPKDRNGRATPTSSDHRLTLYLRCEAKGGKDEYTSNSCCDHLAKDDNFGVCPDNAITPTVKEIYRQSFSC